MLEKNVQGSRSRHGRVLLLSFLVVPLVTACGADKQELTENWEADKRSAFQAFRDRKYDASIAAYENALENAKRIDPKGIEYATTLNELAVVYAAQDKIDQAEKLYAQSAAILEGIKEPTKESLRAYCDALGGMGKIKHKKDDLEGAANDFARGVEAAERANESTKLRELVYEYKSVLRGLGKDDEADALGRRFSYTADAEALPDAEAALRERATNLFNDGDRELKAHHVAIAQTQYWQAYQFSQQSSDPKYRAESASRTAVMMIGTQNMPMAEQASIASIRDFKAAKVNDKTLRPALIAYTAIERQLGKLDQSEKAARIVLKITEKHFEPDSLEMSEALQNMVNPLCAQRRYAEALPLYERSYKIMSKNAPLTSTQMVMHTCWLSNVYWLNGNRDKSKTLVQGFMKQVLAQKDKKNFELVGRLLNDFGEHCGKTDKVEAAFFYTQAVKVLNQTPTAAAELKRAQALLANNH